MFNKSELVKDIRDKLNFMSCLKSNDIAFD